jgi:hypothetical protein
MLRIPKQIVFLGFLGGQGQAHRILGGHRADLAGIWTDYVFDVVLDQRTLDTLEAHALWRLAGNAPEGARLPDFHRIIFSAPLAQVDKGRVRLPASSN